MASWSLTKGSSNQKAFNGSQCTRVTGVGEGKLSMATVIEYMNDYENGVSGDYFVHKQMPV